MDNLLQALINADRVCNEAQACFDRANNMALQNQNSMRKSLKWLKFCAIVGFIIFYRLYVHLFDDVIAHIIPERTSSNIGATGFFFIVIPVSILLYFVLKKRIKNKFESESQKQCGAERLKGQNIIEANKDKLAFLPSDYWYPLATSFMVKTVQAGRATTLPEAIDKLEEQLHRWRLEESNAQILAQQQAQSQQLAEIAQGISGVRSDIIWSNL